MKQFPKICAIALIPTCLSLAACSSSVKTCVLYKEGMDYTKTTKRTPEEYVALTYDIIGGDEVMPIGGFYVPYASGGSVDGHAMPNFLMEDIFQKLEDCGINIFAYSVDRWVTGSSNNNLVKALELCEEHNIGYFIDTYYVRAQLGTHTEKYPLEDMDLSALADVIDEVSDNGNRKAVVGLLANDEPFTHEAENINKYVDAFYSLENVQERKYDVYMNALGYWEGKFNFHSNLIDAPATYDEYMQAYFSANKHVKMLSVTQYPYTSSQTSESQLTSILFNELATYRRYAKEYGVAAWRMLQAGGQWNDSAEWIESVSPYPNEAELLFDVNTSLAFGAKAIQYFPLIQPLYFAYQKGGTYDFNNRNGLIGADGNLTRWYYYAKRANTQIKAIDHVLMKSANDGILVHGDTATKYMVTDASLGDALINGNSWRELSSISGDDCFVGCFDYQGGTALYCVNYSRKDKADVELNFDNNYRYEVIQRGVSADVVGNYVPLTLDAGEAALIVLS